MTVNELTDRRSVSEENQPKTLHLEREDRSASLLFKPWLNADLISPSEVSFQHNRHVVSSDKASAESDNSIGASLARGASRHHEVKAIGHDFREERSCNRKSIDFVVDHSHGVNSLPYLARASHVSDDARLSLASDDTFGSLVYPNVLNKRLFTCPYCRYLTDRKNNLKRHVITMHRKCDRTLECCGLVFNSKAALRDHVIVFHNAGYSCRYCSRNFCRKALLKRHLAVHSGRKDFSCDICDYATSHKSNLDRHRKIHERIDKTSESLSPSNEALRQNVGNVFPKAGAASDTCTESSSEVDIDGDGRELPDNFLSSPLKPSLPQVHHAEEHLMYSITRNFGQLGDPTDGGPTFPHYFHPNALTPSAFRPLRSHVNTFLKPSGVFYHDSSHPSFFVSSFQSNFNFGEACAHFSLSRPSDAFHVSSDRAAHRSSFHLPRAEENVEGKNSDLSDISTLRTPGTYDRFDMSRNDTTKSVLDPDLSIPSSASADISEEPEERSVLEAPLIFRLVDVISSDWEKRKEMLKIRSTKKGKALTACDLKTSGTDYKVADDSDHLDVERV